MELSPGFAMDLFACEPYVMDPVDMAVDAAGRVFVVEMPDYPFKPKPGEGKGRIKQLHDRDGDGQIDSFTLFVEGISEITSILPWRKGLLVAAAPNILYLIDEDNDGQSDSREIVFTGFFENNSEAQITNLKYGIDNWIYASNHGQGGEIKFLRDTFRAPLQIAGGDFRFRLDRGEYEVVAGPAQFGQAFNDRWHRFVTQNTLHIRHIVIPWRYTHRHPYLPSTSVAVNISDHELEMFQLTPPPYWRAERTRRRQKKYDEQNLDRREYAEDHFTGCSGGTFYGGHAFPPSFYGNIFTGDVAGNLVHRDVIKVANNSPTYIATRSAGETDREFLASTDSWFRPTHFYVAPDGFLYVVDYYRQHIETPLSIPVDLKEDMDFMEGDDRGRLYRIRPDQAKTQVEFEDLTRREHREWVALLAHPNRWQRLQAQRLILESQDVDLLPLLEAMLSDHEDARTRLHALYCLEGLDLLSEAHVQHSIQDDSPMIREHALVLAEAFPALAEWVARSITDQDLFVALQATLSIGQWQEPSVYQHLHRTLVDHGGDPWFRMAVLSSQPGSSLEFLEYIIDQEVLLSDDQEFSKNFLVDFSFIVGCRNQEGEIEDYLHILAASTTLHLPIIIEEVSEGLTRGLEASEKTLLLDPGLAQDLEEKSGLNIWAGIIERISKSE